MTTQRHHSDIVIAGLTVFGLVAWFAVVVNEIALPPWNPIYVGAVLGAVSAGALTRWVLSDLDLGELAIAAALPLVLAAGMRSYEQGRDVGIDLLVPLVATEVSVLAGALLARRRRGSGTQGVPLAALAAACAFGCGALAAGLGQLLYHAATGIAAIAGVVLGGGLAGRLVPQVRWVHGALGLGPAMAGLLIAQRPHDIGPAGLAGGIGGLVLGALGAGAGAWLRPVAPKPELPEVRQVR